MADERVNGSAAGASAPLEYRDAVTSTNDVAIQAALDEAPHGWAVSAGRQTAGRGRRGHVWASPAGSLYLSVVLRPQVPMQNFIALSAVCSMGVIDMLHELGLAGRVGIKWPNDIVARVDAPAAGETGQASAAAFDRKLVGVLVEARAGSDGPFAVAGMGINVQPVKIDGALASESEEVAAGPKPLAPISLAELLGEGAEVPELTDLARMLRDAVVARVDAWAAAVRAGGASAGPLAPILSEYFDMVPMLGHQVAVLSPTGHLMDTGVFAGLDVWGRACVMTPSGEKALPAEAVSLRAL